jgi:CRISPR-associated protein Csb2
MSQHLVLTIRFHDGRYHGVPVAEWPPAPSRVFQALVAGVARGHQLSTEAVHSLEWLERLPPPTIAAPVAHLGERVDLFVPNNDLDSVGGDPAQIGSIRTKKTVQPHLFEAEVPLIYAWPVAGDSARAASLVEAANDLYQLGRGVDMAWALGELLDEAALSEKLREHQGEVLQPSTGNGADALTCPTPGSLASLRERHHAASQKLRVEGEGKAARTLFKQPPKPRFVPVSYARARPSKAYELRSSKDDSRFAPWPLKRVSSLVALLRDAAVARLLHAMPAQRAVIERAFAGIVNDGEKGASTAERIHIVPLASIGHEHVDREVRRVAIVVPNGCPLPARDIHWTFSGLYSSDSETGEVSPFILTASDDRTMVARYETRSATWRSVTAIALPDSARRRRIDPTRQRAEAKSATERLKEEQKAVEAIRSALRHAGVRTPISSVRVQREPFERKGTRAEAFAEGPRFKKELLWHAEIQLEEPIEGPLVIGDGRFFGLGVMAPVSESSEVFAFSIAGDTAQHADGMELTRAFRRAVMSRVQKEIGSKQLGIFFSGHEEDRTPAKSERSGHLAYHWDPLHERLLVIAPHLLDRREATYDERFGLKTLRAAVDGMTELFAGRAGRHSLSRCVLGESDEYVGPSRVWGTVSPYTVTRHLKKASAAEAIIADVKAECIQRGWPIPEVSVLTTRAISGLGLQGKVQLTFPVAIEGPVALGRTRYLGGGLFIPLPPGAADD